MKPRVFLPTINEELFHYLQVGYFFQLLSVKFTSCRLPQANLLQHLIHFSIRKRQVLKPQPSLISFHLYGMMITLGGSMKKTGNAYGVIKNFTESMLIRLLLTYWGKKGMHIKSCYVAKDKAHTTRYQELQHYKQTRKGVLLDYSENIRASITSLQNKSSAVIKSTIHWSSKSITSSNDTNSSVI